MAFFNRTMMSRIDWVLENHKSVLLLGARQTGKTTLLLQKQADLFISLIQPATRIRYETHADLLNGEIQAIQNSVGRPPLVILDEIQRVPELIDIVQDWADKKQAQFILSGSSARKLKKGNHINLLPGRVIRLQLDPLSLNELPGEMHHLEHFLYYGTLPEVASTNDVAMKEALLRSYVTTYLEEEIRAEALVRQLGNFARFLELAAIESGNILNLSKMSQDIGISPYTIQSYYDILEDCLIVDRIEPYTKASNSRRRLTKSQRYLFYDLGVRRLAAQEGIHLPRSYEGRLFEQWVGQELIRQTHSLSNMRVFYWKDVNGPEVDWLVEREGELIPIEVKLTDQPTLADAKHLQLFLHEYDTARRAYIVSSVPRKIALSQKITAIPWQTLWQEMA